MLTLGTSEASVFPKPKISMLPILVVLFLISYGLMSVLVVEQGRTIDSQRHLIRDLFNDSVQLSALKTKDLYYSAQRRRLRRKVRRRRVR